MAYTAVMFRHLVEIESTSSLPKDRIVNSWYTISTTDPSPTEVNTIAAAIAVFYTTISTWGASIALTGHKIVSYRLSDPEKRVPVNTHTFGPLTTGPDALSRETAMVLTFQAAIASGDNPRTRKGRIYVGPWNASGNGYERPSSAARTLLTNTAKSVNDTLVAMSNATALAVHSEKDQTLRQAVEVWMDDAWDTQRRRGLLPTTKTVKALYA